MAPVLRHVIFRLSVRIVPRPTTTPSSKEMNPRSVLSHRVKKVSRPASANLSFCCLTKPRRESPPSRGSTPIQYPWKSRDVFFPGGCAHRRTASNSPIAIERVTLRRMYCLPSVVTEQAAEIIGQLEGLEGEEVGRAAGRG